MSRLVLNVSGTKYRVRVENGIGPAVAQNILSQFLTGKFEVVQTLAEMKISDVDFHAPFVIQYIAGQHRYFMSFKSRTDGDVVYYFYFTMGPEGLKVVEIGMAIA